MKYLIKGIMYTLIYVIIGFITNKHRKDIEIKKNNNSLDFDQKIFAKVFFTISFFMLLLFFVVNIFANIESVPDKLIFYAFESIFVLGPLLMGIMCNNWHLNINDDKIIYTNYFGKTIDINASDVNDFRTDKKGNALLFINNGKKIKFDKEFVIFVKGWLTLNNRIFKNEHEKEFIITHPVYEKIIFIISSILITAIFISCIFSAIISDSSGCNVIVLFGILLIVLLSIHCLIDSFSKYDVDENSITYKSLFKNKIIYFSDIESVTVEEDGNVLFTIIKGKNGIKFKINNYWDNAYRLEKIEQIHKKMK